MTPPQRPARVADIADLARAMPYVTQYPGSDHPVFQVGGKSFLIFRNPRPDAVDEVTGERYDDVVVIWVPDESDKQAMVQDPGSPWFSTPHFDGHSSVLVRTSRIGELSYAELAEVVEDAWLSRVSRRRRDEWLAAHRQPGDEESPSP